MPVVQAIFDFTINVLQVAGNGLWETIKAITLIT